MKMNDFVPFLGCSELNVELVNILKSAGADIQSLSRKKLRSQGIEGLELRDLGLFLTFEERQSFERSSGQPRDAGEAILAGVFAYGQGSKTYAEYKGAIPFSKGAVAVRADALREFGTPSKTEVDEDEDTVDWDDWFKNGLQLRCTYRADGSIKVISVSVPLK